MTARGALMTVLRSDRRRWPRSVVVVGVIERGVVVSLPRSLRLVEHTPLASPPVLLDVRALHETTDQRHVVAIPAERAADGSHVADDRPWQASGAMLAATDSRVASLLQDVSGYAYLDAIALHDRIED